MSGENREDQDKVARETVEEGKATCPTELFVFVPTPPLPLAFTATCPQLQLQAKDMQSYEHFPRSKLH